MTINSCLDLSLNTAIMILWSCLEPPRGGLAQNHGSQMMFPKDFSTACGLNHLGTMIDVITIDTTFATRMTKNVGYLHPHARIKFILYLEKGNTKC